jgi:uncharacterized protein (TIGR02246 family)
VTDVERLLACEQIRQLASRYALALDSRDMDMLVELYVPDVPVGRKRAGRDALREVFDGAMRLVGMTFLNVGTHVIEFVDDDHATGHVYCKGEIQDGERWIHQAILYRDAYERRDGRWYFARMRDHQLFYGAETGVNPLTLPPANWPEHHDGMGTVPGIFETWTRFWT